MAQIANNSIHAQILADEAPGYDCVFVRQPPEEIQTDCPICYLVLRQPAQMQCCGNVYCIACIRKELRHRNFCPTCKEPNPTCFLDKRIKQSLSAFRVHCIHYAKQVEGGRGGGCDWVGQLGDLERHINKNPPEDTKMNGCLYVEIKCKFCHNHFRRSLIEAHQSNHCTKRPHSCPHCQYNNTYIEITEVHIHTCPCFPVQCPHCKKVLERKSFKLHISNECTLVPIVCDFHLAGCQEKLPRSQMKGHISNNAVYHAQLLAEYAKEHGNDRLQQHLPMLTSCVETLTTQNEVHVKEISSLRNIQLVLFLAVSVLVLILAVLYQKT